LIEEDIFKMILPLTQQDTQQVEKDNVDRLLEFCNEPKTREEMQEFLGLKDREHFRSEIVKPLLERELLKLTIPDKPTSPNQKYYRAKKGFKNK